MRQLSEKQLRIAVMLAEGLQHKEIALKMGSNTKTIESYIYGNGDPAKGIEGILGVSGRAGIVKWALEQGLLKNKALASPPFKIQIEGTPQLAKALMNCAEDAANGRAEPMQVNALCSATQAFINLARLQMEVIERKQDLPWLLG